MMKKFIFILTSIVFCVIMVKHIIPKLGNGNLRSNHTKIIKNHILNKTLQLSKEERFLKGIPPNKYFEEKYLLEINPKTGRTYPENTYKIQQKLKQQQLLKHKNPGDAIDNQWVERGPNNVGGRTRMVFFDPNDATHKRVFAAGVSGGLWVNNDITDVNSSWQQVAIDENLSITCMAVDPNNTQIMYLGTGELYVPQQALGNGIWKSIDGGTTWTNVYKTRGTTSNGFVHGTYYITDIVVRDKDGDNTTANDSEVFVSIAASFYSSTPINTFVGVNDYGIFKSTDNGANWNRIILDVNGTPVAPNDFEIGIDNTLWMATTRNVYGFGGGSIYNSSDGINFTLKHTITDGRRTEISVSKQNPNTVYVLGRIYTINSSNQLIAPFVSILKTTDGFATIPAELSLPNDLDNGIPTDDFTRGQAFYDLMIEVDPTNDAVAYVGGIDLFKTKDSGANWEQISKWSHNNNLATLNVSLVHADQHEMVFHPTDPTKAIFGNDGGVYYASNLTEANVSNISINPRNKDYNTVQFYNGAVGQSISTEYFLAGSQDNGTHFLNNPVNGMNSFTKILGGDGGQCYIDKDNSYMIVTTTYNRIKRINLPYTGNVFNIVSDGTTGSFINAMALDDNLDILYTNGSSHLARFTDITTNSPKRENITDALLNDITAIKVSPFTTNSSKVFAGTKTGKLVKIEHANTNTQTITDISDANFLGSISAVEFGSSENEIMVTFYNFGVESIWFTTDGGASWEKKQGDFPDTTVRCILMNPLNSNQVIIGTELGVWYTQNFRDALPNWKHSYNGMSNVAVTSLSLRSVDNTVLATTFGRGCYTGKFRANHLTNWTGNANTTDWTNASNWSNGVPTSTTDVNITSSVFQPIINTNSSIANLAIETNAALTIEATGSLSIEENLINKGNLIINSSIANSGSLIVRENSTGNITYNRAVGTNWHLTSAPVVGQLYNDTWVSDNAIASGTVNTNQRGIANYNNNDGTWQYMLSGESDIFQTSTGYSTLKNNTGNLSFTGKLLTNDTIKPISKGTHNAFNLIGNPYASYIPLNIDANSADNFLINNSSILNEQTIWLWDGATYITINHTSGSQFIAPGQGFFVSSKPAGGNVLFHKEMQSHQSNIFLKSETFKPAIVVKLSKGKQEKETNIFYLDNTSLDFDNGYDSSLYTGISSDFEIFTKLANQKSHLQLAIQSIPKNFEIVVPLGYKATPNSELSISLQAKNFNKQTAIYLEDRVLKTFTELNITKTKYVFTSAQKANNNNDRFYIHTSLKLLSSNNFMLSDIIVKYTNKSLEISNLPLGKNRIELYSLLGKKVFAKIIHNRQASIPLNLKKGVYILKLITEKGSLEKKYFIK